METIGSRGKYFVKHALNTCLSWAVLWSEQWPRCQDGSRVRCGLPRANSRPAAGPGEDSCFKAETNSQLAYQGH